MFVTSGLVGAVTPDTVLDDDSLGDCKLRANSKSAKKTAFTFERPGSRANPSLRCGQVGHFDNSRDCPG